MFPIYNLNHFLKYLQLLNPCLNIVDRMIKRICDPVGGVTPASNRIGQDVDRVIQSAFAIIRNKGCVVHGMTPRNGNRWVAP